MIDRRIARMTGAGCLMLLAWLSSLTCKAHDDVAAHTARSELAHFTNPLKLAPLKRAILGEQKLKSRSWLRVATSTSAAFAASIALTEMYASRLVRSRGPRHRVSVATHVKRASTDETSEKSALMRRVSDLCLASKVHAAGATLLIWLTSKSETEPRQSRTLVGPMVLRGMNGAGLVLREKF